MTIFEIKTFKSDETAPTAFAQILANFANYYPWPLWRKLLLGKRDPRLYLEIVSIAQGIHFYLVCEDYLKSYFQSQIVGQYPKARVIQVADHFDTARKIPHSVYGMMRFRQPYYYPLNTARNFKDSDPLGSVLGVLSRFTNADYGVVQIALRPAGGVWQAKTLAMIDAGVTDAAGRRHAIPNEKTIREKLTASGLRASIRLFVGSTQKERVMPLISDLAGSFGVFARGDGNSMYLKRPWFYKSWIKNGILDRKIRKTPRFQILNIEEIVTMFHPPTILLRGIKNISWGGQLMSEPPQNLPVYDPANEEGKKEINFFARTEFKNEPRTFGLKRTDRRRHTYVIGKTGTGKTTLIANMAISDIKNGEGMAIIDPHGDLCEILLRYIPKNRINDVAYLDPSDVDHPFHLNPLEVAPNMSLVQAELIANSIVSIFHKLYAFSWGPRMEYMFRSALLTLSYYPDATLVDLPPLLTDPLFRKKVLEKVDDRVLLNFWNNEYANMHERLRSESISPILNKVGQFVSSPMIRNIIGHPHSTIDFGTMMDQGKVVIINLSQGKLGEDNAALLGAMFITKMQLAAMGRVYQKEEDRRDFFLFVDEFQNFATESFLKILSEARKYRLNLTLANQYVGQIDEQVQKAIFGNVGTIVSFLVGANDARALSFEYGQNYEPKDFVNLGNYQILIKMAIDGLTSLPFYATTLPLPKSVNQNRDKVIAVSRERYTKPKK